MYQTDVTTVLLGLVIVFNSTLDNEAFYNAIDYWLRIGSDPIRLKF